MTLAISTERPKITDHIDPFLGGELLTKLPPEMLLEYEVALHDVKRWGHNAGSSYGDVSYLPKKPGFVESDLEHTCGMLDMLLEMMSRYPNFATAINYRDTALMIGMHDAGEIIVGDAPANGEARKSAINQKIKRIEPKAALKKIIEKVPDEGFRGELGHLYHRFISQHPDDFDAITARLLDKTQGTTRAGVDNVFRYRDQGLEYPSHRLVEHVRTALEVVENTSWALIKVAPQDVKPEILDFALVEIGRFREIGFSGVARTRQVALRRSAHLYLFDK